MHAKVQQTTQRKDMADVVSLLATDSAVVVITRTIRTENMHFASDTRDKTLNPKSFCISRGTMGDADLDFRALMNMQPGHTI